MNNEQKIRRALRRLLEWTEAHTGIYAIRVSPRKDNPDKVRKEKELALAYARKALALSPCKRNCDIGTPEEQAKRFNRFCMGQSCRFGGDNANKCPLDPDACEFEWGQMPYEEKGAGE